MLSYLLMKITSYDVIVIGAGQSGLAAGYHLQQTNLRFTIFEKGEAPTGSWPDYYESLRLFSPAAYSSLPGYSFPRAATHYPTRDEVSSYLSAYAKHFQLPIQTRTVVEQVEKQNDAFIVTTNQGYFSAKAIVAASGAFNQPYWPELRGQNGYEGQLLHAAHYRRPEAWAGQRIVIVGGGNSAIQIAAELSRVANVTLATRRPLRFFPQTLLGYDVHVWLHKAGIDRLPVGEKENRPILDTGTYQQALRDGLFDRRPLFQHFTSDGVVWSDGKTEKVDTVLFATGYRPSLNYLTSLNILKANEFPLHKRGIARHVPGLYFVGLPGQRNAASATLRGSGQDAAYVVHHLQRYLNGQQAKQSLFYMRPQGQFCYCCC